MTDFYCDISAVGNEYQVYNDTPTTWGVPQDGNGKAGPGHSAAVAIAVINCTSAVGDGSQTLSILGITVSNTSTGSGAALAASLVTSINATTTATTATYCQALLPLNKLIFARQKPDELAKVQVMLRIAGADWNGRALTHAGFTTGPVITAFAGGVNGPFGYFINTNNAAFGKAGGSGGNPGYGISILKSSGIQEPSITDPIYVRSARGGSSLSMVHLSVYSQYRLGNGNTRLFIIDNGTTWAGDNGQLSLYITSTSSSTSGSINIGNNLFLIARNPDGFLINAISQGSYKNGLDYSNGNAFLENIRFEDSLNASNQGGNLRCGIETISSAGQALTFFKTCSFSFKSPVLLMQGSNNGGLVTHRFERCTFEYGGAANSIVGSYTNAPITCEFIKCRFFDRNALVDNPVTSPIDNNTSSNAFRVIFDQCEGVNPTYTGLSVNAGAARNRLIMWLGVGESKEWRYENGITISEWRANSSIPTLGHMLPNGLPWAIRCLLREAGSSIEQDRVARITSVYRGSPAIKTLEVELLVATGVNFTKEGLFIEVSYIDEDGFDRTESSSLPALNIFLGNTTSIDTSTASWDMNGASGLSPKKLSLVTDYPIKQGSEVTAVVTRQGSLPNNADQVIYIAPQVSFV